MFAGIKVAHPSCQIRNAVACWFFNKPADAAAATASKNLVLASIDRLWIYSFNTTTKSLPHATTTNGHDASRSSTDNDGGDAHIFLECMAEYPFHGKLLDVAWIPLAGGSAGARDSLVLAFADAKISVVEYDPLLHDLRTVSMHYYENDYEGLLESRQQWTEQLPIVRADTTHGRFIVGQIYDTKLFVIACSRDITGGMLLSTLLSSQTTDNNRLTGPVPADQMPSIVIDCSRLTITGGSTERISCIVDIQIVPEHAAEHATIVMLCRREASGMMADSRYGVRWNDSCLLVVMSIDYVNKTLRPIWTLPQLPSDCCRVACVPDPLGGFLLMSHNIVAYVKQGVPPYTVAVNDIGRTVPPAALPIQADANLNTTFVGAKCEFLERDKVLIGSNNGRLYVLTLVYNFEAQNVSAMHWQYIGMTTATSTIASVVKGEYVFIGSRLGDSLLMRCQARDDIALQNTVESTLSSSNVTGESNTETERRSKTQ